MSSNLSICNSWLARRREWIGVRSPGLLACGIVALAATFLGEHYGGSAMLFALLLGMAVNFLSVEGPCLPGIEFAASKVLRFGVALLGLRITFAQVTGELGWQPLLIVVIAVVATILFGVLCSQLLGFNRQFGLLTGGSVGICGASAAMAIAAILPPNEKKERALIFTVIGVSTLSTAAMLLYPIFAQWLHLGQREIGIFLGGTIHDVAQVVGAGYGVSQETGDIATLVKLLRVAMLVPVIFVASLLLRRQQAANGKKTPLLPGFVVAFVILVAANSSGFVPAGVSRFAGELSRWCLVISIAAIGIKTQLKDVATVGMGPVLLMVIETLFLMGVVVALMAWFR
jgi:uncharacterized integral membrane protein (TIGR00698 family)